jgi:hypothetical protein
VIVPGRIAVPAVGVGQHAARPRRDDEGEEPPR